MSNNDKNAADTETILMALDQISQTIEVMTSVVGKLRNHMERREAAADQQQSELQADLPADKILH
ncbi:MAG: hypothetical protein AB8C02_12450 [Halioglobus sp.]